MPGPGRNTAIDTIRLVSLLGISIVNVAFLALPTATTLLPPEGIADNIAAFAVEALFQSKFFLLFSFIFGWGVHIQERAASRDGAPFQARYLRRLAGLAVLGCLHAILVFSGDILLIYALIGLMLLPLLRLSARALRGVGYAMVPVSTLMLLAILLLTPSQLGLTTGSGLGGSFIEAVQARLASWPQTLGFLLMFQGPLVFGAFALGLAAGKADFFAPGSSGRMALKRRVPLLLSVALPLNLAYAASLSGWIPVEQELWSLGGFVAIALGGPMLAAVYLHFLLELAERYRLPSVLGRVGQNSLTAYVLQGVVGGFFFGGYGLGLFGEIGLAALIPTAVAITAIAMAVTGLLARIFGSGPLEVLLRNWTYLDRR